MNDGTPGDDLTTLFPEEELEIMGEAITVRPISFLEGVRLSPLIQPMLDDIAALFEADDDPQMDSLMGVFVEHEEVFIKLESLCCGKPEEWVTALDDRSGHELALTFWTVNASFFIRRLLAPKLNSLAGQESLSGESSLPH